MDLLILSICLIVAILIIIAVYLWVKAILVFFLCFKIQDIDKRTYNNFGYQAIGVISLGLIFTLITILLFINSESRELLMYMAGFTSIGTIVCFIIIPLRSILFMLLK